MRTRAFAVVRAWSASLACIALLIGAPVLRAQTPPPPATAPLPAYRYRILGIYDADSGTPVEGVVITDVLSGNKVLTTSTGTATLAFLPDGGSFIRITKIGYETQTFLAAITPKDTAALTIVLVHASSATTLPTVVTTDTAPHYVSGALQGFEERRKEGIGHFISEAELRKNDARSMSDMLEHMPGLVMVTGRGDIVNVASGRGLPSSRSMRGGSGSTQWCYVSIYTDGNRVWDQTSRTAPPDISQMNINQYAGIEFYAGGATAPAQFNASGNSCGTLLFWTRER